ncbi:MULTISPECIES: HNH endonuclease signature motif containing protein [unclassified Acinetobacter]|uniref:HNH endonuclease signature motif containing protein n=1 Tax=unclassified Acinetobacter TaxID=196816 RepID=UPI002935215A|nr:MULTISPECIES: HNH endonuclease signature motif containing protein [unclassified Acinetobacter]WOE31949.1 HNH endonuclease signature motif containing protein [Acinetobacter sp. SAAs470]WOE37417.1 HNH endonuclease signature motif containing protein [Acinetobacter sp. SAAs474]
MPKPIKYTQEQLDFIKSNCVLERKDLTAKVNARFGTLFSVDNIKSLCTRNKWKTGRTGCFEKGNIPVNKGTKGLTGSNKTSFKKGQIAWNKKPIGYERMCSKDGYVLIKTAEPNIFDLKHCVVWEKAHGPVPENHIVAFKNQDRTDCRLDNLILMSKAEMVRYSQSFHQLATPQSNESCLLMAKIKNLKHKLGAHS